MALGPGQTAAEEQLPTTRRDARQGQDEDALLWPWKWGAVGGGSVEGRYLVKKDGDGKIHFLSEIKHAESSCSPKVNK